ncbi:MAG: hypothetical protein KAJ19_08405, partial [Gammaproteobacteria bacterium]|nr:hypothetical protein [Gammaproteobacteria bacterium]
NSYALIGDANGFFDQRYGASAWSGLTDAVKESLLITATMDLDRAFEYNGIKLDGGQALEFPRFLRRGALDTADSQRFIPREVMEATCEQAWSIYGKGKPDSSRKDLQAEGLAHISLGRVSESYVSGARKLPSLCSRSMDKLRPWITSTKKFGAFSPYDPVA